jgi:hypothetical protein
MGIHEFLEAERDGGSKLVDAKAKPWHDEIDIVSGE